MAATLVVAAAFPALRHARLTVSPESSMSSVSPESSDEAAPNATDGAGHADTEPPTKGSAR
ncbi:hypothetical protein AB0H18_29340 [Streptomyces sp. NPDC020766]|uniref:hypothetical protein n=1 Tax=Streptomyces sp. NPDC020766 TaxID=3155011 RepID=UPI0033F8152F